ncbi:MAG: hypothetical protein K0V04_42755 [Deltaproteobacteria bacterium]|nr:hypothetical protein [Deltaproteobacteria bacterium]
MSARPRSRRSFVAIVIAVAFVAVAGGALLAYMIFTDEPRVPPITAAPPRPPAPVEKFEADSVVAWNEVHTPAAATRRRRPARQRSGRPRDRVDDSTIGAGLGRLQAGFDACARDHGAVTGSIVRVDFSVTADGSVDDSQARAPHRRTPLGRCVADVLAGGRFGRSTSGRRDIHRSIALRP